jgi:hypothetical protein
MNPIFLEDLDFIEKNLVALSVKKGCLPILA